MTSRQRHTHTSSRSLFATKRVHFRKPNSTTDRDDIPPPFAAMMERRAKTPSAKGRTHSGERELAPGVRRSTGLYVMLFWISVYLRFP